MTDEEKSIFDEALEQQRARAVGLFSRWPRPSGSNDYSQDVRVGLRDH